MFDLFPFFCMSDEVNVFSALLACTFLNFTPKPGSLFCCHIGVVFKTTSCSYFGLPDCQCEALYQSVLMVYKHPIHQ